MFMKQPCDSSDDYKFPVTANEALSEKTAISINACARVGSHITYKYYLIAIDPSYGFSLTCFQNKCTHHQHALAKIFTTAGASVVPLLSKGATRIYKN